MSDKIVVPTSVTRPLSYRGPIKSSTYNDTQEEIVSDITSLANSVNSLHNRLTQAYMTMQNENQYLRRKVDALYEQATYNEKVSAENNYLVSRFVDFSNTENISFANGLDDTASAMLFSEFGEVTLPPNAIENKFYVISITSNKIIPPVDLDVRVKGTFDKGDGEGLINYERGGIVNPGNPEWAFNGINDKLWVRRVEFPIDSRVDQVEVELTVTIPEGSSTKANTIELLPFPNGSVDITQLSIASDLGDNFITVDGFTALDNITAKRYHFPATTVDQIRIRLRQRNWVEENGKKVFYYGMQEVGLKLVDYDKSYTRGAPFGTNNSFTVEINAPQGYSFYSISRVDPSPNFLLEDMSNRHIHLRLGTNSDPSVGIFWTSDTELTPQDSGTSLTIGTNKIYAFVELNYVESSGGVLSPFKVGTTPYMYGLGLSYLLVKT